MSKVESTNRDLLDEIEACLTSEHDLINYNGPEQPDMGLDNDCYSHTELESLSSLSSDSDSLSSSGEFAFDHQLNALSSMVNQMNPFFSKLRNVSQHLSRSTQELHLAVQNCREEGSSRSPLSQRASTDIDSLLRQATWSEVNSPVSSVSPCDEMLDGVRMRRGSVTSNCSSNCRDVFSPVNMHRVSVLSLTSAFSFLAAKGSTRQSVGTLVANGSFWLL